MSTLIFILFVPLMCIKSKITKVLNSEENSKRGFPFKWQNQKLKHIKRMDNNFHIPELVQAFSYVEHGRLNQVYR